MTDSNRRLRLVLLGCLAASLLTWGGCAASQSSGSVSDSLGSFSDSSGSFSDSSTSSSGDDVAYRGDVRAFTVAHVSSGGTPESLRRGLSDVALARGISDWEAVPATFTAVGAGLQQAGVPMHRLLAYQQSLAVPGTEAHAAIGRGYRLSELPQAR
ncbi:MAG: putative lipoprotein [bacterium]|nr:putative lipoprotein [bacterium]